MPLPLDLLALVLAVAFIAAMVRVIWGFGDGIVGIPILSLLIGLEAGAPVLALMSVLLAILLLRERPGLVDLGVVARLLAGALAGAPLGLYVLTDLPEVWAHRSLGVVLIGFAIWALAYPEPRSQATEQPPTERRSTQPSAWLVDLVFGVGVGACNVAFDISGPILLIHAASRGWSHDELRVNLQAVFLPLSLVTLGTHAIGGLWTRDVLVLAACVLPGMLLALLLGTKLRAKLDGGRGTKILHVLIFVLGVLQFIL